MQTNIHAWSTEYFCREFAQDAPHPSLTFLGKIQCQQVEDVKLRISVAKATASSVFTCGSHAIRLQNLHVWCIL